MNKNLKILVGYLPEEYGSVEVFKKLGSVTYFKYDRGWLIENIHKYNIIITHLFDKIDKEIINKAENLNIIATPSTGTDHIDKNAVYNSGIRLISLNDDRNFIDTISSTAEITWLLILACARKFPNLIYRVIKEGSWVNTDIRGIELQGKTIGILGYGRLGRKVAEYANSFKMNIIACDIDKDAFKNKPAYVKRVSMNVLLMKSDIITLHVKLNPTSRNLIGNLEISKMKYGVIIVNTSRGELIDSNAIFEGIKSGKIKAVGLDVLENEYQSSTLPHNILIEAAKNDSRIIITPHAGGSTYDAHSKVFNKIAELISHAL